MSSMSVLVFFYSTLLGNSHHLKGKQNPKEASHQEPRPIMKEEQLTKDKTAELFLVCFFQAPWNFWSWTDRAAHHFSPKFPTPKYFLNFEPLKKKCSICPVNFWLLNVLLAFASCPSKEAGPVENAETLHISAPLLSFAKFTAPKAALFEELVLATYSLKAKLKIYNPEVIDSFSVLPSKSLDTKDLQLFPLKGAGSIHMFFKKSNHHSELLWVGLSSAIASPSALSLMSQEI